MATDRYDSSLHIYGVLHVKKVLVGPAGRHVCACMGMLAGMARRNVSNTVLMHVRRGGLDLSDVRYRESRGGVRAK
jgi:hypothetical protein